METVTFASRSTEILFTQQSLIAMELPQDILVQENLRATDKTVVDLEQRYGSKSQLTPCMCSWANYSAALSFDFIVKTEFILLSFNQSSQLYNSYKYLLTNSLNLPYMLPFEVSIVTILIL